MVQSTVADDAEIRRENFRRLWPGKFSPSQVALELGRTAALWSDLYHGRKSFGEKIARYIEEKKGLARMSLDDPGGAKVSPLTSELLQRLQGLGDDERRQIENMLRGRFDMPMLPAKPSRKQA